MQRTLLLLISFLFAHFAYALPAPMSSTELEQKSDIIGTFRVLAVIRTNDTSAFNQKLPTYQAWMKVLHLKKGNLQPNDTLLVRWHEVPTGLLGPWQVVYNPGETVETFLVKDLQNPVYFTSTWWNVAHRIQGSRKPLPSQIGSTVVG